MPAYVIVDVHITHPEEYEEVKKLTPPVLSLYGGKYLARSGNVENLSGDWNPERIVLLEFPNLEKAKAWVDSPEYGTVKVIRDKTARVNMVAFESLAQPPREMIG